jgi:type I restriction enzyme M protein
MSNLTPVIKSIQDVMRQDAGVNGDAQRIEQLTWLLFLKVFDALEEELELTRDDYKSPIPETCAGATGRPTPKASPATSCSTSSTTPLPHAQEPAGRPGAQPARLRGARRVRRRLQLHEERPAAAPGDQQAQRHRLQPPGERHQFNDLYEKILRDLQSAGNAGEFYTPRAVTQFMVDMVNPQLGEKVLDPATGTGGFLVCAIEHLRKQVKNTERRAAAAGQHPASRRSSCRTCCASPTCCCTASRCPATSATTTPWPARCATTAADRVDVVLTNPPFGGIGRARHRAGLPADVRTKETADLFLVLIKHILKDGGRAALVLPDGTLFGEGVKTPHQGTAAGRVQPAHHRAPAQRRVRALHRHQDQPAVLHQGPPTTDVWYYEHPYPAGREELQQDQADPHRGVRRREGLVGQRGRWLCGRAENERAWKVSIDAIQLQPRPEESRTSPRPKATTPSTCWPTTPACRPRRRRCVMN